MNIENFPTSESAKRMMSYITGNGFYDRSWVGKWIFQVMGQEMDEVRRIIVDELPYQAFPETATWGLRYLEEKYGLPVRENLSYEERRALIKAKRDLRAPMTPYRMELILGSLTGREITVDDMAENLVPNTFTVTIHPGESIVDFKEAYDTLNQIKQSHTTYVLGMEAEQQQDLYIGSALMATPSWTIYDEGLHQVRSYLYVGCALQPAGTITIDDRG